MAYLYIYIYIYIDINMYSYIYNINVPEGSIHDFLIEPPSFWIPVRLIWYLNYPTDEETSMGIDQNPKIEVLYRIRQYFIGIFPYIGLT